MNRLRLRLERLAGHHDVANFASGNAELDGWLQRHALAAQQMDSARTFVLTGGDRIVGYFALTMGSVRRADAPAKLVRALPAYPVGMVLVARLALHRNGQSKASERCSWLRRFARASVLARRLLPGSSSSTPSTRPPSASTSGTASFQHPSIPSACTGG